MITYLSRKALSNITLPLLIEAEQMRCERWLKYAKLEIYAEMSVHNPTVYLTVPLFRKKNGIIINGGTVLWHSFSSLQCYSC